MCGRFTYLFTWRQLQRLMRLTTMPEGELSPRYNVAPTQLAPVVRQDAAGVRSVAMLRWGLVPPWSKDLKSGPQMINARSEGAATSRVFCGPLQRRRCLVPVSGFYEWKKAPAAKEGRKQPYYIRRTDGDPMVFAGLWERWSGQEGGDVVESFTILTTGPNELLRPLHDRMPVILAPGAFDLWLDAAVTDVSRVESLLRPYAGADVEAYPVSTWVNSPAHEDARCVEPIAAQ